MAAVDGWFSRIRQVAAMCPPMRAHWRHLANTIELVHPSAHLSPQHKQQIDRFSRFCTCHGRKTLYFTMGAPIMAGYAGSPTYTAYVDMTLTRQLAKPCMLAAMTAAPLRGFLVGLQLQWPRYRSDMCVSVRLCVRKITFERSYLDLPVDT